MKIIKNDIWNYLGKHPICIPTNGFIKNNGKAVMGRGLAQQCLKRFPSIDFTLGQLLKEYGNVPFIIDKKYTIISFPVKPILLTIIEPNDIKKVMLKFRTQNILTCIGKNYAGWMCKADLDLIENSCKLLVSMCNKNNYKLLYSNYNEIWDHKIILPKVGCGFGELKWTDVEPIIEKYLGDNVIIVDKV